MLGRAFIEEDDNNLLLLLIVLLVSFAIVLNCCCFGPAAAVFAKIWLELVVTKIKINTTAIANIILFSWILNTNAIIEWFYGYIKKLCNHYNTRIF
jgi:hypothetical protein